MYVVTMSQPAATLAVTRPPDPATSRPAMSRLSRNDLARVLGVAGFTEENGPKAFEIAMRESGGDPRAHSAVDGGLGLFQIHPSHVPRLIELGLITKREDLFDPVINARVVATMVEWWPDVF